MRDRPPMLISDSDFLRLTSILTSGILEGNTARARSLARELARAHVVPAHALPLDVVSMNSRLEYCDDQRRPTECTIVYPWDADPQRGLVSVFAPLGCALIGRRAASTTAWENPSGRIHHWTVLSVRSRQEPVLAHS